jgi:hypothetical protein
MTPVAITLADVLRTAPSLPWREALYLPVEVPWDLSTRAILFDSDDLYDAKANTDEVPQPGMRYVHSIADVRDIVNNARQQRPECSLEDLLKAFLFYYERDAFIELEE